jgi:multidrug efflux pump
MPIQEYPQIKNTAIIISTAYPGASAEVIQGYITTLLSRSIASAEGIDYLSASSKQGLSTITAHLQLNYDADKALVDIQTKLLAVAGELPIESKQPVLMKKTGNEVALMYIGYTSTQMTQAQIADYLATVVVPVIQAVPGVGEADIVGTAYTAMRIWLEPQKLLAYQLTATESLL